MNSSRIKQCFDNIVLDIRMPSLLPMVSQVLGFIERPAKIINCIGGGIPNYVATRALDFALGNPTIIIEESAFNTSLRLFRKHSKQKTTPDPDSGTQMT